MDEYADFIEASIDTCDPAHAARQKELEKRIRKSFRMNAAHPAYQEAGDQKSEGAKHYDTFKS